MQNQLYLVPFMKLMIRTSCSGLLKMGEEFLCRGGQDGPSQELFKCSVVLVFASVCSVSWYFSSPQRPIFAICACGVWPWCLCCCWATGGAFSMPVRCVKEISSSTEVWNGDTAHICERSLSSKLALVTDCSYTRWPVFVCVFLALGLYKI